MAYPQQPPFNQNPNWGGQSGYPSNQGGYQTNYNNRGGNDELWSWFQAVDQDHSGQISADELRQALVNGNWTPFNLETCRLMIGMFDRDQSGTINIEEFTALWKYIADWKLCFDNFDRDRSGTIQAHELQQAFQSFGYNLSPQFSQICVRRYDQQRRGCINFDDFIQCCVMLRNLTESFKRKDTQLTGMARLSYEDFLQLMLEYSLLKSK